MASKTVTRSIIKIRKTEKNAIVIEAATLSHRASYRRVQKNLSKSLNLKSPLKGHLSVVCCFFSFYPSENNQFLLFLQSANYSPKSSSTKNRMATNAFISSLSLLGGKSDESIQTDVFNLIEGFNLNWKKKNNALISNVTLKLFAFGLA